MTTLKAVSETLENRLATLREQLGLTEGQGLTAAHQELLRKFNTKSGFMKYWFVSGHESELAPILEFAALSDLNAFALRHQGESQLAKISDEDAAFLAMFPANKQHPDEIRATLDAAQAHSYSHQLDVLKKRLSAPLASPESAVREYFCTLRNQLTLFHATKKAQDPILAHRALIIASYLNQNIAKLFPQDPQMRFTADDSIPDVNPATTTANKQPTVAKVEVPAPNASFSYSLFFGLFKYTFNPAVQSAINTSKNAVDTAWAAHNRGLADQNKRNSDVSEARANAKFSLGMFFDEVIRSLKSYIEVGRQAPQVQQAQQTQQPQQAAAVIQPQRPVPTHPTPPPTATSSKNAYMQKAKDYLKGKKNPQPKDEEEFDKLFTLGQAGYSDDAPADRSAPPTKKTSMFSSLFKKSSAASSSNSSKNEKSMSPM